MKITLDSKYEIHRKIAKLFVGCTDVDGEGLVGYCTCSRKFVFDIGCMEDRVILDLDTAEPDLRLAIGEPISFKAYRPFSNEEVIGAIEEFSCVTGHLKINNIECRAKDIRLSREWLESQGVEVSE